MPKGGSTTSSCNVSALLKPQNTASGSIKLVVTNSHYTSKTATESVSVFYQNTMPLDPFKNVNAGCYVATGSWDTASSHSCYGKADLDEIDTPSVQFSVGDYLGIANFQFSNGADWSVVWSGGCTGAGFLCKYVSSVKEGEDNVTATVSVTHKPTAQTKSYSVEAHICVVPKGKELSC